MLLSFYSSAACQSYLDEQVVLNHLNSRVSELNSDLINSLVEGVEAFKSSNTSKNFCFEQLSEFSTVLKLKGVRDSSVNIKFIKENNGEKDLITINNNSYSYSVITKNLWIKLVNKLENNAFTVISSNLGNVLEDLTSGSKSMKSVDELAVNTSVVSTRPLNEMTKEGTTAKEEQKESLLNDEELGIEEVPVGTSSELVLDDKSVAMRSFLLRGNAPVVSDANSIFDSLKPRRGKSNSFSLGTALKQSDLDLLVSEYEDLIKLFQTETDNEIATKLKEEIENQIANGVEGKTRILELIDFSTNINKVTPFGLDVVNDKVSLTLPSKEGWYFKIKLKMRFESGKLRKTTNVKIHIKNFKVTNLVLLSQDDSGKINVEETAAPIVKGDIKLSVSNDLLNLFVKVAVKALNPVIKKYKKELALELKDKLAPEVQKLKDNADIVSHKESSPNLQASGVSNETNYRNIVDAVETKLFDFHMPHNTVVNPRVKNVSTLLFKEIEQLDLSDELGGIVHYNNYFDSAIFSGMFLASLGYKYSHTNSAQDLARIKTLLTGVETLAHVNDDLTEGKGGLLSRCVAPKGSKLGDQLKNHNNTLSYVKEYKGVEVVAFQGDKGITRDQYAGVMFGLSTVFSKVNDEEIKKQSKDLFLHLIDYLIYKDWNIDIDSRREVEDYEQVLPLSWAGIGYQKVTYLLMANQMEPSNEVYRKALEKALPLIKSSWLTSFVTLSDPVDKYYKFNLLYTTLFSAYERSQSGIIRFHLNRIIKVLTHYIGHHKNAYFDLIRLSIEKKSNKSNEELADLISGIKESFSSALNRNHQVNDESLAVKRNIFDQYHNVEESIPEGYNEVYETINFVIPREFVKFDTSFMWQRSPFYPTPISGNVPGWNQRAETSGIGIHLVYWIGKDLGVFE
jgi:hypothetical protein